MSVRFREIVYHNYWKKLETPITFRTCEGRQVTVLFVGNYNLGAGPDFLGARLRVDDGSVFTGNIEIHEDEGMWHLHEHEKDLAYASVALHVFFQAHSRPGRHPDNPNMLRLQLSPDLVRFPDSPSSRHKLMGICGIALNESNKNLIFSVVNQAAESRLLVRVERMRSRFESEGRNNPDDFLYRELFASFGLPDHAGPYREIAGALPYGEFLRDTLVDDFAAGFEIFHEKVKTIIARNFDSNVQELLYKKKGYPAGFFENRILQIYGLFHATREGGLVRSLRKLLLSAFPDNSSTKRKFFGLFNEALKNHKQNEGRHPIGRDRVLIVLVNVLLPFFLVWAEEHADEPLRQSLYKIYLLAPIEKNSRLTYMRYRLDLDKKTHDRPDNLRFGQGLIQIRQDCCRSFEHGCENCSLAARIHAITPSS